MSDSIHSGRFYSLQEVSAQCGLAPYILRYWELHFPELTADNSKPKHMYNASDISLINRIKKLLYVEHLTIEQAKSRLKQEMAFPVDYSVNQTKENAVDPQENTEQTQQTAQTDAGGQEQPESMAVAQNQQIVAQAVSQAQPCCAPEATSVPEVNAASPSVHEDEIHRVAAEELAALRGEVQSLRALVEEEHGKAENAKELLSAEVAKVLALTQTLQQERSRTESVQAELAASQQQIADLKGKLAELEQLSAQGQSACEAELASLRAENVALKGKVAAFVEQLRELSSVLTKVH